MHLCCAVCTNHLRYLRAWAAGATQAEFEALLRSQYPWAFEYAEGRVAIRYEDESGDLCLLSSQSEWDALCHNPLLGRIVRVFINHEMPRFIDGLHYTIKAEMMEEVDDEAATERSRVEDESQSRSPIYDTTRRKGIDVESENGQCEEEGGDLAGFSAADLGDPVPSAPVRLDDEEDWTTKDLVYGSMMVLEAEEAGWATITTTTTATATTSAAEPEDSEPDRDQHDGAYDKDGNYYERMRWQQGEVESQAQAAYSTETTAVPTIVVEQVDAGDGGKQEGEESMSTEFCPSSPLQIDASAFPAARRKSGAGRRLRRSSSK